MPFLKGLGKQDGGKVSTTATILFDEIKSRLSGNLDFTPQTASQRWAYKKTTVSPAASALFNTNDNFLGNLVTANLASGDKIIWVAIKHSGYVSGNFGVTKEGAMINFAGINPVYNAGTGVSGVLATTADPSVFTSNSHGFSNGDIVKCSGFTEMTEINGLIGTIENVATNTFNIKGVTADAQETTGGIVAYAGINTVLSPGEMIIMKLNGVSVSDLKAASCVLSGDKPSAAGDSTVYLHIAAIIEDV